MDKEELLSYIRELKEQIEKAEFELNNSRIMLLNFEREAMRIGKKPIKVMTIKGLKTTWVDKEE